MPSERLAWTTSTRIAALATLTSIGSRCRWSFVLGSQASDRCLHDGTLGTIRKALTLQLPWEGEFREYRLSSTAPCCRARGQLGGIETVNCSGCGRPVSMRLLPRPSVARVRVQISQGPTWLGRGCNGPEATARLVTTTPSSHEDDTDLNRPPQIEGRIEISIVVEYSRGARRWPSADTVALAGIGLRTTGWANEASRNCRLVRSRWSRPSTWPVIALLARVDHVILAPWPKPGGLGTSTFSH